MTELTKDDIKEMVNNFIRAWATEIEKTSLPEANQFADDYLTNLARDMSEEQVKTFTDLAAPHVHKILSAPAETPTEEEVE